MVSAAKAFSKEPPKRPLDDPSAVVEDFQWRYKDRDKTDQVVEWCKKAPTFNVCVDRAVEARDEGGKHHNHQSKVKIADRRKFGTRIKKRRRDFKAIMREREESWHTRFDMVHDLFDDIKPKGIGPVTVYDVAVRVCARYGIEPMSVYLHAGVRQGFKALVASDPSWDGVHGLDRVPLYMFPPPLCDIPADEVEDILCTYREIFLGWNHG